MEVENATSLKVHFAAGAVAGLIVDVTLFPLDTLKTRLQSNLGFWKSGGFRGVYCGLGPTTVGAAPTAALFFTSYQGFKNYFGENVKTQSDQFMLQMCAAAFAEVVSCISRVPTDVVKQRRQTSRDVTSLAILHSALRNEGLRGIYRGFFVTVLRDAPFSILQYPLWEYLKKTFHQDTPLGGAFCGAIAGAFAGAVTTPLDVIKTRKMLWQKSTNDKVGNRTTVLIKDIWQKKGITGFFAGLVPRTIWIFLGGFVFFGSYETAIVNLNKL